MLESPGVPARRALVESEGRPGLRPDRSFSRGGEGRSDLVLSNSGFPSSESKRLYVNPTLVDGGDLHSSSIEVMRELERDLNALVGPGRPASGRSPRGPPGPARSGGRCGEREGQREEAGADAQRGNGAGPPGGPPGHPAPPVASGPSRLARRARCWRRCSGPG